MELTIESRSKPDDFGGAGVGVGVGADAGAGAAGSTIVDTPGGLKSSIAGTLSWIATVDAGTSTGWIDGMGLGSDAGAADICDAVGVVGATASIGGVTIFGPSGGFGDGVPIALFGAAVTGAVATGTAPKDPDTVGPDTIGAGSTELVKTLTGTAPGAGGGLAFDTVGDEETPEIGVDTGAPTIGDGAGATGDGAVIVGVVAADATRGAVVAAGNG